MTALVNALMFSFLISANGQYSNWVERKNIDEVRKGLAQFYSDCGFYPDRLEKMFEKSVKERDCAAAGDKNAEKWEPTLADTPANREAVSRLTYTPFGYTDYELSMRLFWTRED